MKFQDAVTKSLSAQGSKEYRCNAKLSVNGSIWTAYSVSIAHRDLLFSCDRGSVTYLIDTIGSKNYAELFDWEDDCNNA